MLARLARIPSSPWHVRTRLILGIATFFDAFDLLTISFALPAFAQAWAMAPWQIGLVISAAFYGQIIGALCAGPLADRFGRLPVVAVSVVLYALMSIACALAWNPASLVAFRFVQGIGLGAEVPIATTYVNEIAPAKVRGAFYVFYELVFVIGLVMAGVLGAYIVPHFGWRVMFYIGALPLVLALVLQRLLLESPRWLVAHGRVDDADAIVTQIEASVTESGRALPTVEPIAPPAATGGGFADLFRGVYRKRTFCVWAMWFCCFSTTYGLATWLPTLYKTVFHLDLQTSLIYGNATQITGFAGSFVFALLVDRVGRKPLFVAGFLAGGAALLALCVFGATNPVTLVVFVAIGAFFMNAVSIGLNLYTPELYPTRVRAIGSAVGSVWQRVAAGVGPLVVAALLADGLRSVFAYFGALAIAGGVIAYAFATETNGQTLEELSP